MPASSSNEPEVPELDVRGLPKPHKHPTIFETYSGLPSGGAFVLVNDHDPRHLREEFERDHAGSYGWEYLTQQPRDWRIKISKLSQTPLPRVLANTMTVTADPSRADASGAVWTLQPRERDLDSNIIALPPDGTIAAHTGADLDVLIHVLAGSGWLATELDTIELTPGALLWLPRKSWRQFTASSEGLRYLTVHQRRKALVLDTSRARETDPVQ